MMHLFNAGLPVQTRNGDPAFFIACNPGLPAPILAEVCGRMESYTLAGQHLYNSNLDLMPAPVFGFYNIQTDARFSEAKAKKYKLDKLMEKSKKLTDKNYDL